MELVGVVEEEDMLGLVGEEGFCPNDEAEESIALDNLLKGLDPARFVLDELDAWGFGAPTGGFFGGTRFLLIGMQKGNGEEMGEAGGGGEEEGKVRFWKGLGFLGQELDALGCECFQITTAI
ncbi:hypothetical protein ACLOJK_029162 [Asimina triloba]